MQFAAHALRNKPHQSQSLSLLRWAFEMITVAGGLHRSLQRRADGSSDHLHDKTTPGGLHGAAQSSERIGFFTQVNLLHYQIWKNDHRPLRLLNAIFHYSYHTSASNRTLLEKISGVCITLISLHINISQFRLKNAFVFEEKGI